MTQYIALIRGINVGSAKRIAMADLRALVEDLGGTDVRTLLNSGNAVFSCARTTEAALQKKIEARIEATFGFSARVVVLNAARFREIVSANPLPQATTEPQKILIGFFTEKAALTLLNPLADKTWQPDQLALGAHACYFWCTNGVLESALLKAATKLSKESMTTRNWTTVLKLTEMLVTETTKPAKR